MKRRVVYGQTEGRTEELCRWAAAILCPGQTFPHDTHAIASEVDGEIAAVTLWNSFDDYNCLMSIASDGSRRWMTREFLYRSFAYPFVQLGLPRVTVKIDEDNLESVKLGVHLGFQFEGSMRKAAPGGRREIIMGLLKEECRWIDLGLAKHAA